MYNYNTYINGDGAKIKGVEITAKTAFTFLPGFLSGFGVDANYTYQKAKDVRAVLDPRRLAAAVPGPVARQRQRDPVVRQGPFNARLAYNYRSKYLVSAADNSGQPVYRDSTGYLDGKVTWKPDLWNIQGLSFFVEGKNLTKEEERSTAGDIRLTELGYFGRRFFVGMTAKF
jgi:iron complex outermembrane receptor protein